MNILGLHIGHDASACIIKNDRLSSMIEKERITRHKYDRGYSDAMLDYVLEACSLKINDIDCVAISVNPQDADSLMMVKDGKKYRNGPRDLQPWECEQFEVTIKGVKLPAYQVQHHVAHIASSYYLSNLDNAIGLSYDASYWPDNQVSYITQCVDNHIYLNGCPELNAGILYDQITRCIFGDWTHAGKTMGLAAWGKPSQFNYSPRDINGTMMMISSAVYAAKGDKAALAATAQYWLERDIQRVVSTLGTGNLVVSGGTALNVVANRIYHDIFDNVYIAPFCHDSGQSVGGALYVLHHINDVPLQKYDSTIPFMGNRYGKHENTYTGLDEVADAITNDSVVLWHQGRSEMGHRALTHRSMFARPDKVSVRVNVSETIKGRESFRPVAPIVKAERCSEYFDIEQCPLTDFMLVNAKVKDERLEGITHVDGTARVQTVSKEMNPVVWELLDLVEQRIGYPVLINTSLNIAGEPICETHTDTINTFNRIDNGILWLDGEIITKSL